MTQGARGGASKRRRHDLIRLCPPCRSFPGRCRDAEVGAPGGARPGRSVEPDPQGAMEPCLRARLETISRKGKLAEAIRYALSR